MATSGFDKVKYLVDPVETLVNAFDSVLGHDHTGAAGKGPALTIAAIPGVTASAAELNLIDGSTAGTVVALKALVVGADKNLDTLVIADGGLKLGSGAGTAVTSTAAELNILDGVTATAAELNLTDAAPATFTFAAAAGASNVCEVTITVKDAAAATLAVARNLEIWLSDAATGLGITGTVASGTVTAKAASGTVLTALTAKKHIRAQTLATGVFILEITDTAKTGFYVCVSNPLTGGIHVSSQLVAGNYGA